MHGFGWGTCRRRLRYKWKGNIKMDLKDIKVWTDLILLRMG
jgi:hypothetical protein